MPRFSAHLGAGGDLVIQHDQVEDLLALLLVNSRDQHATGGDAHHLTGRQVQNGDGGLADEILGGIVLTDAGEDGTVNTAAIIEGELQQLVALLHGLAVLDLHGAEIGLEEGVEVHFLLHVGLQLDGGQGSLTLRLLQSLQLGKSLLGVDAGEQVLALGHGSIGAQSAPDIEVPKRPDSYVQQKLPSNHIL